MRFDGAVLTGGASTRMGSDKALVAVGGEAMALRVARALHGAGASRVFCVGGDERALRDIGLEFVADDYRGEGPLGGIITALRHTTCDAVVIAPCDMPWIEAVHVEALVRALDRRPAADVATSPQHLFAAWRTRTLDPVEQAFRAGERAPKRALACLQDFVVELPDGAWSTDVDTPQGCD